MTLHRFWFKFPSSIEPFDLRLGCGVTSYNYDDAVSILTETVFAGQEFPEVESFVEDVDVRTLDQNHVVPNMEPPVWRGVWFPQGFVRWSGTR